MYPGYNPFLTLLNRVFSSSIVNNLLLEQVFWFFAVLVFCFLTFFTKVLNHSCLENYHSDRRNLR